MPSLWLYLDGTAKYEKRASQLVPDVVPHRLQGHEGGAMQVALCADGRPLDYDDVTHQFAIGGTPVELQVVAGYDRAGQLAWVSSAWRDWFQALPPVARPLPVASQVQAGRNYFIAALVVSSIQALLFIFSYPTQIVRTDWRFLIYAFDAAFHIYWMVGLALAYAARRRGQPRAVAIVGAVLGISFLLGGFVAVLVPPR